MKENHNSKVIHINIIAVIISVNLTAIIDFVNTNNFAKSPKSWEPNERDKKNCMK